MRCLKRALSLDGTLGKREQRKRTLFFVINATCLLTSVSMIVASPENASVGLVAANYCLMIALPVFGIIYVLGGWQLTPAVIVGVAWAFCVSVMAGDLVMRTFGEASWALLVLVVDFLLVMQVDARYTVAVVLAAVAWLCLMALEENFRFGIFDMPGLHPQGSSIGRRVDYDQKGDCVNLPCRTGSMVQLILSVQVFVIDFIATRGFAREILKEQAMMQKTINTVQEIASLLAGYDVERVAELLAEHEGHLPEEMTEALRSLEENLRVYKAYLPKTCLPFGEYVPQDNHALVHDDSDSDAKLSSQTSSMSSVQAVVQPPLRLTSTKATLLTMNIKDTLLCLERDTASFAQLFTSVLSSTLDTMSAWRGMVDVFVGDRIHCSFNASRQCANHATSALHTATMLMQGGGEVRTHVNMGVAMGKVLRGDMGCHVMRRFSMVGALVRDVLAIERAGRVLGCDVLCNRLCFSDAECEHNLRLIPCKVELAANREAEVLGELVVLMEASAVPVDEWMYQIGEKKDWEDYNQAVRGYLKGETSAEAVSAAAQTGACALYPVKVKVALVRGAVLRVPVHGFYAHEKTNLGMMDV